MAQNADYATVCINNSLASLVTNREVLRSLLVHVAWFCDALCCSCRGAYWAPRSLAMASHGLAHLIVAGLYCFIRTADGALCATKSRHVRNRACLSPINVRSGVGVVTDVICFRKSEGNT